MTAVTLRVPMATAGGEECGPSRKERCGDRGRGSPSLGFGFPQRTVHWQALCQQALSWVPPWLTLSLFRASELQGQTQFPRTRT